MIIEKLSIVDFKIFKGRVVFDLKPRVKRNHQKPIILFGGLNGAGKTTTLTAVRLALYGRQSLGLGTSQKAYEEFLRSSIHRAKNSIIQPNCCAIEITFRLAEAGVMSHYRIQRSWTVAGKKVKEFLKLHKEGHLTDLNYEQVQVFLNELIPIGVSDLFFFDGEKIKELAEDQTGFALTDAIKRLLGLDLIDKLHADLTVLLRSKNKKRASDELKKHIVELERQLKEAEANAIAAITEYESARAGWQETTVQLERLNNDLNAQGGNWALSRNDYLKEQAELTAVKQAIEMSMRELINESYPFALAPGFIGRLRATLDAEEKAIHKQLADTLIAKRMPQLKKVIIEASDKRTGDKLAAVVASFFNEISETNKPKKLTHELSAPMKAAVMHTLDSAINTKIKLQALAAQLEKCTRAIEQVGVKIARAPDEQTVALQFQMIKEKQETSNIRHFKMESTRENARKSLRDAIEISRKLDALHQQLGVSNEKDRVVNHAIRAKDLLLEFNQETAANKVQELETQFVASFQKLARKEDIEIRAKIDAKTFEVHLIDTDGSVIDKNELSAGEKQVYAISILEALARTSGRNLPIIIDTPLGRLDSKHRSNLVEHYFPYASQQVILLSTDTEVDEQFYADLFKHISHAYKLEYSSADKCTTACEGYFWRTKEVA